MERQTEVFGYQFADGFGVADGSQSSKYGEVIKDVTVFLEVYAIKFNVVVERRYNIIII